MSKVAEKRRTNRVRNDQKLNKQRNYRTLLTAPPETKPTLGYRLGRLLGNVLFWGMVAGICLIGLWLFVTALSSGGKA